MKITMVKHNNTTTTNNNNTPLFPSHLFLFPSPILDEERKTVACMDLLMPGVGEVAGKRGREGEKGKGRKDGGSLL